MIIVWDKFNRKDYKNYWGPREPGIKSYVEVTKKSLLRTSQVKECMNTYFGHQKVPDKRDPQENMPWNILVTVMQITYRYRILKVARLR